MTDDASHPGVAADPPSKRGATSALARRVRFVLGLAILGVLVGLVLRLPSATSGFVAAFRHFQVDRLPWLAVAALLETASLAANSLAHRTLQEAGSFRMRFRSLLALMVASTSVVDLIPAGVVAAGGWLVSQYRTRGAPLALAVWVVLAGGFASTVCGLALLLVGAGVAGVWNPIGLVLCGIVLVAGSAGFIVFVHDYPTWSVRVERHVPSRLADAMARTVEHTTEYRVTPRQGAAVLVWSSLNWLLDAAVLAVSFVLLGFPVPWTSLLFAYFLSQMIGGLSFLRIGVVEGGLVAGFVLTGLKAAPALAAILVYRVISFWMVAAVGAVIFVVVSRRQREGLQAAVVPAAPSTVS